ncbi:hypothetical protein Rs2_21438 [Raphanus sativus]|nr:hypothetical protein Rs2_21438 [Raphanus sativus]
MTEDDLNSVLRQGPFHFNFCMFVLVHWEPIVHDEYPWIIPFWVRLIGFPLHLWTDANLRNIGGRIGNVDTVELTEGRMLIEVDSRRPLRFSRKVEYEGDEVTIDIKYDLLFKHCTTCGMLSHEESYCPLLNVRTRIQLPERQDVFSRVQIPYDQTSRHDSRISSQAPSQSHQALMLNRAQQQHRSDIYQAPRGSNTSDHNDSNRYQSRAYDSSTRGGRHADRIIRKNDRYSRSNRYGGPYDRPKLQEWKAKSPRKETHVDNRGAYAGTAREKRVPTKELGEIRRHEDDEGTRESMARNKHEIIPYEPVSRSTSLSLRDDSKGKRVEATSAKKLASKIVTPSREQHKEINVTVRNKNVTAVFLSPLRSMSSLNEDDQVIGALSGMELTDPQCEAMLEDEVYDDDLLGMDLMEMESNQVNVQPGAVEEDRNLAKMARTKKLGVK